MSHAHHKPLPELNPIDLERAKGQARLLLTFHPDMSAPDVANHIADEFSIPYQSAEPIILQLLERMVN